ncbi:MAG: terminase small subunit [Prolixibacteraceae bacterium]|nr:terminase small subunit [Prolixibacteraceae bacterium]
MSNNLTIKQEKFVHVYLETGNASEAYRRAYSYSNMKDATINRKAAELLRNGKITARVDEIQRELKKSSDIKKEAILEELACIAFSDIRDYMKFDGKNLLFKNFDELTDRQARAIESIKQTRQGIELKLHGKSWTIERISKMMGFDKPEDINLQLEGLPDSVLDTLIEKLLKRET